ncbi:MAG: hypothetical protein ACOC2N_03025 [Spirochaetota bacterium]
MTGVLEQSSVGRSVHLGSILRAQYSSAKVSLPVDGGIYARFKHIQGVPSSGDGYSLNKLRMLDIMVERLSQLRGEPVTTPTPASGEEASAALESLARRIHDALAGAQTPRGSFAAGVVEPGVFFDLVA